MAGPHDWADAMAPSLDVIAEIAEAALVGLPDPFRELAGQIVFQVRDFADPDVLDELGIEDAFELTGLYHGRDLAHSSLLDAPSTPMVFLYRRPILDEWSERGDVSLGRLVRHVLIHEIGHHLGLSDHDIERIEATR